jgi:Fanconi anemia group M protein
MQNKDNPIFIHVDHREDPLLINLLSKYAILQESQLKIGDYIISERAIIERKTRDDFECSIIDGRMFDQAIKLKDTYERVIYIIEGKTFEGRVNRGALLGAISSLILDFGFSVFFTPNVEGSVELIVALAKREQGEGKNKILIKSPKKSEDLDVQLVYTLASFPMLGEKAANNLLERFGTIENIINSNEQKLSETNGISIKRSREILDFVKRKYNKKEKN